MRLNLLTKEYQLQGWWANFTTSMSKEYMHMRDNSINDYDDMLSNELAKYGGTFEVPFIYIEFEDEARANWFILRWS